MTEENIKELFRLVRELNDRFQDMIDELRKENRADLQRCQDAYCTPRHKGIEDKVKNIALNVKSLERTVLLACGGTTVIVFLITFFKIPITKVLGG